jgi:phage tail-like protein
MADWKGRGKGRTDANNGALNLRGGAGMGSGRPGSQPNLTITGGAGKGGGRGSSNNPSLNITGGPGKGGGNASPNVLPTITGGVGKGGGRSSDQPSLGAKVEYGGTSLNYRFKGKYKSSTSARAETSIGEATGPETSPRVADPEGNFIFALEIEKVEVAQFRECSGLKTSTQVFELEEGGQNHRVHKLPGQSRWDNVVLRYGVSSDVSLLTWRNEILQDEFGKRRNGSVVMKTLTGKEVRRYNFIQGWPVAWEGPHFNAEAAELAVEMIS